MAGRRHKRRPERRARSARGQGWSVSVLLAALLISAAGAAAYANSFAGVFVFDDEPAVVENPHIRRLWPLTVSMSAPAGTTLAGRPIASLSFAIDYALAPPDARDVFVPPAGALASTTDQFHRNLRGYHATNLAIHLFAALTLFGIVRRTLLTGPPAARFAGAAASLALSIALVWVVHPLQTAAVTYVVQRVESLMALFYLLTLYCAIRAHERDKRVWWIAGAVTACVLGMGTKEVMVTAPLVVMLWDLVFAPSGGPTWRSRLGDLWWQRWPLYVGLALTWIVMAALVAGGHRPHAAGLGFEEWPWWRYLLTQTTVVTHYLRLAFVPHPLVLDYAWPPAATLTRIAPPLLLLAALFGLTMWGLWRRHPAGFAGSCFFLILAPTSSVYPIVTEVAAEHRMYLPLAAVISLVVLSVYALGQRAATAGGQRLSSWASAIAVATVAIGLASLTAARNRDYHSYERIWSDTIRKQPQNARARTNYATALLAAGRYGEAEEHLRVAVALEPRLAEAHTALGATLSGQGNFDEGIEHLQKAIALEPDHPAAHQNLGEAHAARGDLALAAHHFLNALDRRPDDIVLLNRAGWILATAARDEVRDGARAARLASHAASLTGRRDVISLDTLAAAHAESERFSEAVAIAREALALAEATRDRAIVPELEHRLALYEAGRKFRQ